MKLLTVLLSLIVFTGCGLQKPNTVAPTGPILTNPIPPLKFSDENFMYQNTNIPWNGKRLVAIHGGQNSDHIGGWMITPEYAKIVTDLTDLGWQVIMFDRPIALPEYFQDDGGYTYRLAYKAKLDQILQSSEAQYGVATETDIAGISYGGLHALMGINLEPGLFDKYVAINPVTKMNALAEFKGVETPYFDPTIEFSSISKYRGLVTYSSNDTRVDFTYTEFLISELTMLSAPLSVHEFIGTGHSTDGHLEFVTDFLNN